MLTTMASSTTSYLIQIGRYKLDMDVLYVVCDVLLL